MSFVSFYRYFSGKIVQLKKILPENQFNIKHLNTFSFIKTLNRRFAANGQCHELFAGFCQISPPSAAR